MTANRNWIVRVRCTVTKDVMVENCTKETAAKEPFEHAVDEQEIETYDWEVLSVEPNE